MKKLLFLALLAVGVGLRGGCAYTYPPIENATRIEVQNEKSELVRVIEEPAKIEEITHFINARRRGWWYPFLAPPAGWRGQANVHCPKGISVFAFGASFFARTQSDGDVRQRGATAAELQEFREMLVRQEGRVRSGDRRMELVGHPATGQDHLSFGAP